MNDKNEWSARLLEKSHWQLNIRRTITKSSLPLKRHSLRLIDPIIKLREFLGRIAQTQCESVNSIARANHLDVKRTSVTPSDASRSKPSINLDMCVSYFDGMCKLPVPPFYNMALST